MDNINLLTKENNLLKTTVGNLNFLCQSLMQSNQILSNQLFDLEELLDSKMTYVEKFLTKHNLSVEDLIEFENEQYLDEQLKQQEKKPLE